MTLFDVLKRVSRSFYLTLRILPDAVRGPIGLAYLFCRTADTLADTSLLPADERLKFLERFREQFRSDNPSWETIREIRERALRNPEDSAERLLLSRIEDCFKAFMECAEGDRERIRWLVSTLTRGMEMDLTCFPPGRTAPPVALPTDEDLDRYCYYVAGCVGDFWTRMAVAHFPSMSGWEEAEMRRRGVRFGKGLQMTNILKDLSKDLARSRCYTPQTLLDRFGLTPTNLAAGPPPDRYRPLLVPLIRLTLEHLDVARDYALSIPRREVRLRLACWWPLLFALKTLLAVYRSDRLLDPGFTVKITRGEVYAIMLKTGLVIFSNRELGKIFDHFKREVTESVDGLTN
jgi:farnesyl-diphosphate farnesyltransferase